MFRYLSSISNYFMPPKKRTKLITSEERDLTSVDQINDDTIAIIFSHFGPVELMHMRCVCKKWREAAKETIPARVNFHVDSVNKYRAMVAMTTALPNVQNITLNHFYLPPRGQYLHRSGSTTDRYADGEDPVDDQIDEEATNVTTHDVNVISRFSKLHYLKISFAQLNGRYPALFNFPLLQHLCLQPCDNLKCDLSMLAGLPSLKELVCDGGDQLTGDLGSLNVLKDNIEVVELSSCLKVTGNFIILADFPRLKRLDLSGTAVIGDIRDIGDDDFLHLDYLLLSDNIFGGQYHQFQSISEVQSFMDSVSPILRRFSNRDWVWLLSEESPDWYEGNATDWYEFLGFDDVYNLPSPSFIITFVRAGPRVGWRWGNEDPEKEPVDGLHEVSESCEINWLDPEPQRDSFGSNGEYEKYADELKSIEEKIRFYRGYHQPPTEDEYKLRCGELIIRLSFFLGQIQARQGGG